VQSEHLIGRHVRVPHLLAQIGDPVLADERPHRPEPPWYTREVPGCSWSAPVPACTESANISHHSFACPTKPSRWARRTRDRASSAQSAPQTRRDEPNLVHSSARLQSPTNGIHRVEVSTSDSDCPSKFPGAQGASLVPRHIDRT
jgi:hypothetical protein